MRLLFVFQAGIRIFSTITHYMIVYKFSLSFKGKNKGREGRLNLLACKLVEVEGRIQSHLTTMMSMEGEVNAKIDFDPFLITK